jgi:energy-coupling factor transporter ATP-binding protein EcfA2
MGCVASGDAASSDSKRLDAQLKSEFCVEQEKVKLLLLGAGESGKSTIFKQMKVIYGKSSDGFSQQERLQSVGVVHMNIMDLMKTVCEQCKGFGKEVSLVHSTT